jgi:hypothetical protein
MLYDMTSNITASEPEGETESESEYRIETE